MAYIEREALRDELYKNDAITFKGLEILNNFSVANVVQLKHGYWESIGIDNNDMEMMKCSICNTKRYGRTPYCSVCGSKMDGSYKETVTNYDRIMNMSIDEIADYIYTHDDNLNDLICKSVHDNCPHGENIKPENCKSCIKQWLLRESLEND